MPFVPSLLLAALSAALPASLPLDEASLSRLPRAEATLTAHGQTQACEGVWLHDLAAAAGLPGGDAVRGPALTLMIVAHAADSYRVAFSLGEIDAKLGNRRVLIARRCNGQALNSEDGPLRLVVPGEARAARSVRQLQRLQVVQVP